MSLEPEQRFSKLAIASLICGLLGLLNLSLLMLAFKSGKFFLWILHDTYFLFSLLMLGFWGYVPVLFLFIILSIIFGIIAVVRIHRNSGIRGGIMARVGLVLGVFVLLVYAYVIFFWGIFII